MRVVISRLAERDCAGIQSFIAADNPRRALTFLNELRRVRTVTIAEAPLIGAARNEISHGLRAHPHKDYMICYRISGDTINIVASFTGRSIARGVFEAFGSFRKTRISVFLIDSSRWRLMVRL